MVYYYQLPVMPDNLKQTDHENDIWRIFLVDDHAIVRAGFRALLEQRQDFIICGEANSGEKAYQLYQELNPDLVLLDISLPGLSGLETTRKLLKRDASAKIILISMHEDAVYREQAYRAGAMAFLPKSGNPDDMVQTLLDVLTNKSGINVQRNANTQKARQHSLFSALSTREFEIFTLVAEGRRQADIAATLSISPKTVSNYLTQIKSRLGVRTQAELVHLALQYGLVSTGPDPDELGH